MNIRDNQALRERLAAEYVLGTLRGGARRRFEGWLQRDAALRRVVDEWQGRLVPMAEFAAPAAPPPSVWSGIEQRLRLAPAPQDTAQAGPGWVAWLTGLADSLAFWRGLSLASGAAAAILAVTVAMRLHTGPTAPVAAVDQVATLLDDKAQAALVVTADSANRALAVRVLSDAPVADDKTLQLWAITKAGKPRSLGILPDNRRAALALTADAIGDDVALLAVSLEPKGGSPDPNGPTGPVLYKGTWVKVM
jgi:anti-sigma-K factor RskA